MGVFGFLLKRAILVQKALLNEAALLVPLSTNTSTLKGTSARAATTNDYYYVL